VGVGEVTSLVNVLAHAEKYGAGVADSLRAHAQLVRKRRALDAEKRAAKASPKLTVVMVLFILPALFAVVLGPAVVNVIQVLIPSMHARGE
jgi:tight adherence protein C